MFVNKYLFAIALLLGSFLTVSAQKDQLNKYILVCNTSQSEFRIQDLKKCNMVSIRDSEEEVASFVFSAKKKKSFIDVKVEGNLINESCFEILNKLEEPWVVRIRKVIDKKGTAIDGYTELTVIGEN